MIAIKTLISNTILALISSHYGCEMSVTTIANRNREYNKFRKNVKENGVEEDEEVEEVEEVEEGYEEES